MARHCSTCGNKDDAKYSCVCGEVSYCNSSCQKADWKKHRPSCPPYAVKSIPGKGFGLVATRKLTPGVVILRESPLIVISKTTELLQFQQILSSYEKLPQEQKNCVLKLFDPGTDYKKDMMTSVRTTLGLDEESMKVVRIFSANSMNVCAHVEFGINDSALYHNISRINHSCAPNCVWSWNKDDFHIKEVRAVSEIEKGSEIVTTYIGEDDGISRDERRQRLAKDWSFYCSCEVCDLSEEHLRENDRIRSQIRRYHNQIPASLARGNVIGALNAAKKKTEFMEKINDEMVLDMVGALLECYELSYAQEAFSRHSKTEKVEYKRKSFEMAKKFGDCFMQNFNSRMINCQQKYS